MIYTVTFNPSLDYVVSVSDFATGKTNRADSERLFPGGKGLNVSMTLANLGIESRALGFAAGFTGAEIMRRIGETGAKPDFIWIEDGTSRINVKLNSIEGTEINGKGPAIGASELSGLMEKLKDLRDGDVLALAGSIPDSVPDDVYSRIMERLNGKNVKVVVDASGKLLANALPLCPFLVKPNHHELGELFGVSLSDRRSVVPYAVRMREMGAENVLVSMAGQGAVLAAADGKAYGLPAPAGTTACAVGAGDSMVAGFLAGWLEKKDYGHAFCMGVAAGSACAFSEWLATKSQIEALYRQLEGRCEILSGIC